MEKLSAQASEMTCQDWRDFGFYYISNDTLKEWHLHGSKSGLLGFARILDQFATATAKTSASEHEHLGPHMYLTLTTWPTARLDHRGVWGQPHDMIRLAKLLQQTLESSTAGQILRIKEQYTPTAEYVLFLHIHKDSFDPSSLDPQLTS